MKDCIFQGVHMDNTFIELCKLSEKHRWCDNRTICQCDHHNFKAAFLELANGKKITELHITSKPSPEINEEYEDRFEEFKLRYAERVDLMSILLDTDFLKVREEIKNEETWLKVLALMLRYLENSADYNILSEALLPQLDGYIKNDPDDELSWRSFGVYECAEARASHTV
jgi:hypothetical protein